MCCWLYKWQSHVSSNCMLINFLKSNCETIENCIITFLTISYNQLKEILIAAVAMGSRKTYF